MNIFVLDLDPRTCAEYHCDIHINKMQSETAQMLSDRISWMRHIFPFIMKGGYHNHPCTRWVGQNWANFNWTARLGIELHKQYNIRYNNGKHRRANKIFWFSYIISWIPAHLNKMTPFAQAMPEKYKHKDAVKAYRDYYCGEKMSFARWKHWNIPKWYTQRLMMKNTESRSDMNG